MFDIYKIFGDNNIGWIHAVTVRWIRQVINNQLRTGTDKGNLTV